MDSRSRSIAKAVSYRLVGSSCTGLIAYLLTGRAALFFEAGALDVALKIAAYFLHERLWERISFGRAKPPEYEI
jgi:adenylylsulfate kinase